MTKLYRFVFAIIIATTLQFTANAQSVSINTTGAAADPSAILDVSSTLKGVLIPRMDKTQKNAIATPATGLLIYQDAPDSTGFYYYNGTAWFWLAIASGSQGWLTTGNAATDSAINFLGTLDNKPIMLRQNNLWMGQLNSQRHNYFIGGGSGQNNNTTASQNTGFGDSTLYNNTTAGGNTAIGYRSMVGSGPITGSVNTAIGNNTMAAITTAFQNVAIGDFAMGGMQSGGRNVVIGPGAMESATKGTDNIALGLWALRTNDSSIANVAIGQSALYRNKRDNNVAIGYQAGYWNNYLQSNALFGIENTYVGYGSGLNANTGSQNVGLGHRALQGQGVFSADVPTNTAYKRNVAIGDSALTFAYGSDNVAVGFRTLSKSSFSGQHTAVGSRALTNTTAGYPNTAIGYSSMDSTTDGYANTAVGSYSLTANKSGINNVAVGNAAMYQSTAGSNNTAVGNDAGRFFRTNDNTAIGSGALSKDSTGYGNTSTGAFSSFNITSAIWNTANGYFALENDTTGSGNTAVGTSSFRSLRNTGNNVGVGINSGYWSTGANNTYLGSYAGEGVSGRSTGGANTAVGDFSLYRIRSGAQNVAIGESALASDSSGSANVSIGAGSMENHLRGNDNVAIGFWAGRSDTAGTRSVFIGREAGYYNQRNNTVAIGWHSLSRNGLGAGAGTLDSAEFNTAVGFQTLASNTRGAWNTAVGYNAGLGNLLGYYNTAMGVNALRNNAIGDRNTAVGVNAMELVTGSQNTAIGAGTMAGNVTGGDNVAIGYNALNQAAGAANNNIAIGSFSLDENTVGDDNVGIGRGALTENLTGINNVAIGTGALQNSTINGNTALGFSAGAFNTTGTDNTLVGNNADVTVNNLTNATAIGANASVATSNSLVLGSGANIGIGISAPTKQLHVSAGTSLALTNAATQILMEDDATSYLEMSTPAANENGILSSIPAIGIRSAVIFGSNNSMQLRTGGNTNRLYIDNGGYTGVNRTPTTGINAGTLQVQNVSVFDDQFGIYNNLGHRWTYFADNTATPTLDLYFNGSFRGSFVNATGVYTPLSDRRYKKDITDFDYGLNTLKSLQPYKYSYLDSKPGDHTAVGFMAQDLLNIFPEAVYKNTDKQGKEFYTVDYNTFSVLSIKAIQEQQQLIDKQQTTIDDLLKRIEKLEKKN